MTKPLTTDLEQAHRRGVAAAEEGLSDAALGATRLDGTAVSLLAEAAISSASPFLRAPLLSRISSVLRLHPPAGAEDGRCPACGTAAPCVTAQAVQA
jgi:hypothetical protein